MKLIVHSKTKEQLIMVLGAGIIGAIVGIVANIPAEDPYKSIRPARPSTPSPFTLVCSGTCKKTRLNGNYFLASTYFVTQSDGTRVYSQLGRVSVQKLTTNAWNSILLTNAPTLPPNVDGISYYLGTNTGFFYEFNSFGPTTLPVAGANIWNGATWHQSRNPNALDGQRLTYNSYKFGFNYMWAVVPAVSMMVIACLILAINHYV